MIICSNTVAWKGHEKMTGLFFSSPNEKKTSSLIYVYCKNVELNIISTDAMRTQKTKRTLSVFPILFLMTKHKRSLKYSRCWRKGGTFKNDTPQRNNRFTTTVKTVKTSFSSIFFMLLVITHWTTIISCFSFSFCLWDFLGCSSIHFSSII